MLSKHQANVDRANWPPKLTLQRSFSAYWMNPHHKNKSETSIATEAVGSTA